MFNKLYGVWAGRDMELVITEELILIFERKDHLIIASLFKQTQQNNLEYFQPKAIAIFDRETSRVGLKYYDHISQKEEIFGVDLFRSISLESMKLSTLNEMIESLTKIESIPKDRLGEYPIAENNNIGDCLRAWTLGVSFYENEETPSFSASIKTNKHSYTFSFNANANNPMVYCRAARLSSNNNGSVFSQNIRMMKNSREFTAYMAEDNLKMAGLELMIDDSQFQNNMCTFSEAGPIYWSLKEFTKDRIVLNGCGGDEYVHTRPEIELG